MNFINFIFHDTPVNNLSNLLRIRFLVRLTILIITCVIPFSSFSSEIYFENSVGIGDHPNHLDEMDELISKAASANDKMNMLKNMFEEVYSNPKL